MNRPSAQQVLLRVPLAGAPLVALAGLALAGAGPPVWYLLLVVVLGVFSAAVPDGHTGLALVLVVGGGWAAAVPDGLSAWGLLVAFALLVFHLAAVLATYGPPALVLDRALLARWGRRALGSVAVTVLVWVVARVLAGVQPVGGPLLAAAALLLAAVWALLMRRWLTAGPE